MESTDADQKLYEQEIKLFKQSLQWKAFIEEEQNLTAIDTTLLKVIGNYILDIRFRYSFAQPYADDLNRLSTIKDICRGLDPVFDEIAEWSEDYDTLPQAAQTLSTYLVEIAIDLGRIIFFIEQEHPELTDFFKVDRVRYAESLNGE